MKISHKIALTSVLGNLIEYFGFTLFAIFAKQIGQSFFPKLDSFTQLISVFIIFGTGFLSRPIGAVFFGHFGDKIGRKKSLSYTILGMSIITFLIAITPDYESIGILAPILLLFLRLSQGFFVGGEGPGAALYMLEHSKTTNHGFSGGIIIASIVSGSFLAVIIGILIDSLQINNSFSWRIPFFVSSILGLIGLYLRFSLPETQDFINAKKEKKILKLPIVKVFQNYWKEMILIASLGGITTSLSYIIMAFLTPYLEKQLNIEHIKALKYSSISIFSFIISLIILGKVSNKFNPRKFIIFFSYLSILLTIPAFIAINSDNSILFMLGLLIFPFLGGGLCAPAYPYAIKIFNTEVRYSGVGLSYTIGIAIFGGFSPVICSYLIKTTELYYSPAFYIIFLALIYLFFEKIIGSRTKLN
ncbi:MFS transporter [Candidatus Aquarickettsia rohweri]|uniref:MFS transporter n=1 Tax=Candidatus Aquarickettsia rohweri TaxID=2602574 RepID=A0A429XF31_9RICK|nr:MFS transporter [Candidatus Aquarickettsia rohweri]RST63193.1 MFS transporter [Candidatus Aquarickettsia rohweri]